MSASENQVLEQLQTLKAMTVRYGIIHEAQTLQLELWPLLLFQAQSGVCKVDAENHWVNFELSVKKTPSNKDIKDGKELLKKWTRSILWDDTEILIDFTEIKNGRRHKKPSSSRGPNPSRKSTKGSTRK